MQFLMYCPGMPFNGMSLEEGRSLGGSESAAYYMARELARQGHQVTLFTAIPKEAAGSWEGVRYLSAGPVNEQTPLGADFEWYAAATPHDVLIIQRVPDGFRRLFASKVNLWWSHDLALKRHLPALSLQLWNVDRLLAVSEFHREQIATTYDLPGLQIELLPNGVDPSLFGGIPRPGSKGDQEEILRKVSGGVLTYTSRPERGLEFLVGEGGLMERLARSAPSLRLKVAGYDNTIPKMRDYYEYLWERCRVLPNVEQLGALSKKELADLMRSAWLHVYPTTFEEVSCITVMEAQSAGTPVITSAVAALPETLGGGGAVLLEPDDAKPAERFEVEVLALRKETKRWEELHQKALRKAPQYSWKKSAAGLVELVEEILREKSSSPARLGRHLLRHSDIIACRELLQPLPADQGGGLAELRGELSSNYEFVESGNYSQHYENFANWQITSKVDQGHDDLERLLGMPRFRVVAELVGNLPEGAKVLDYGCGEGHFTSALAQLFPDLIFHGVDIGAPVVKAGQEWIKKKGLTNVTLDIGQADSLKGEYEMVVAMELLEHLPQPWQVAQRLEELLAPGGTLCFTVPFGPWEAESYDSVPFRRHIHHLERADLMTMFGHKPDYRAVAVPVRFAATGEPLGAYRVTYSGGGEAARPLEPANKLTRQAPRETLSVCMICSDDGSTLAKALESVALIADQIIIGIDGAREQRGLAWQIGERHGAECFSLPSPLEIGFDSARNLTLERAWCDWVLWIDDDEVFEWPHRLAKYLRPNCYNAYAVKQHHYAIEPEGLIKTDYPCRIFRNNTGIRFYGIVHEHPESALNEGAGPVLLLQDVAICHSGYETEDIRRERFKRNLPLMRRDREVYPDRLLGKFLWIRDLAHLNRYEFERFRSCTPRMVSQAEEAIGLWRELVENGHVRMALDSLPYYSESVELLRGEGIQFEFSMGAACAGLGDLNGRPPSPVRGRFLNAADIRLLTEKIVSEKTMIYEERYF